MKNIEKLFENNRDWAAGVTAENPEFFSELAKRQKPEYLWIGCSDSRVPANQVAGLAPGEVFVHRNIANVVAHTDFNCLSVLEYAVNVLQVKHVIVCGHYGCGGVIAAMQGQHVGLIDNWLRHIRDVRQNHAIQLSELEDEKDRVTRLCELNVIEQVRNVCATTIVQDRWEKGNPLAIHGWIFGIENGLLNDLKVTVTDQADLADAYRIATGT
jgi:carbonic anhydrase